MTSTILEVVQELAPGGRLRVAINYGNPVLAQPHPDTQEPMGISAALAREAAGRLGLEIEFIGFDSAGKAFAALENGAWDLAFMAIDPLRAEKLQFTKPYVVIEGTYLVRDSAPFQAVGDIDQPGVRVAVGKGAAYDLFLTRALQHAEIVRAATSAQAIDLFVEQSLDAAAGVRQPLVAYAAAHPGLRVLAGRFTAIEQAMAVPKGLARAAAWLASFIDEMKANGFVARALEESGQGDATVAP
jgi:polar amino acid transport system substrate-binding protein